MKDKILLFIIGLLAGAVISTGAFFVYSKASCDNNSNQITEGRPSGGPGEQNGENGGPSGENGQPPERPGENSTQNDENNQNDTETNKS